MRISLTLLATTAPVALAAVVLPQQAQADPNPPDDPTCQLGGSDNDDTSSVQCGPDAVAAVNSTAVGDRAAANGNSSTAVGADTLANGARSIALGYRARADDADSVALGSDSIATDGNASIGRPGFERKLTNVAPGTAGTDAVNLDQLNAIGAAASLVRQIGGAPGTGALTVGAETGGTSVSFAGTGGNRVLSGVAPGVAETDAVNVSQLEAVSVTANQGWTLSDGVTPANIGPGGTVTFTAGDANILLTQTGMDDAGEIEIALNTDVVVDSVTAGSATMNTSGLTVGGTAVTANGFTVGDTSIASSGLTIVGGPSVTSAGIDAGGSVVTNVTAGTVGASSTDAVNGSQLFATNQNVATNATAITALDDRVTLNTTNITSNSTAISGLDTRLGATEGNVALLQTGVANNAAAVAGLDTRVTTNSSNIVSLSDRIEEVRPRYLAVNSTGPENENNLGATGADAIAIGLGASANSADSVALGRGATATGGASVSIGAGNFASGDGAVAIGDPNTATGTGAVAIGEDNVANGDGSVAVGNASSAVEAGSLAFGDHATASVVGSVALGSGSLADRAITPASGTIPVGTGYIPYNTADGMLKGAVSVGNAATGDYRQIINVADGTGAQDAVTVRQLGGALSAFAVSATQYFHANSAAPDALAVGAESVAIGPTTVVNGNNGIGIGNGAIVDEFAPGGVAIGQNAQVLQADGLAWGSNATANGIQSIAIGAGANATFSGSVALGPGATTSVGSRIGYTAYGLATPTNSAGEVSVGAAGAERQVTNVAAGSAPTDAVNVSQLNQVAQNTADSLGGGAAYDPVNGAYTAPSYTVAGTAYSNVGDAIAAQDGQVATLDETVSDLAAGVDQGTIGLVQQAAPGVDITVGAATDGAAVNVAGTAGHRRVSGVAPAVDLADAVNLAQLNTLVGQGVDAANAYTDMRFDAVSYDLRSVRDDDRGGTASAMAMAAVPQAFEPGMGMAGVGTATWQGQQAIAVGFSKASPDGRIVVKGTATYNTRGDGGAAAGVGFQF